MNYADDTTDYVGMQNYDEGIEYLEPNIKTTYLPGSKKWTRSKFR